MSIVTLLGVMALLAPLFEQALRLVRRYFSKEEKQTPEADGIESELSELSSLSSTLIERMKKVEAAVSERKTMAENLASTIRDTQAEIVELERVRAISKESVDAITKIFETKLKTENRRAFWQSSLMGFAYMIFGAILGWGITHYL